MERAKRDAEDTRRTEIGGEREIFGLDTLEGSLAPAHRIHLVDGNDHLADAEQRSDQAVAARLREQALAGIDQQHG
jgi:hypothetical protein